MLFLLLYQNNVLPPSPPRHKKANSAGYITIALTVFRECNEHWIMEVRESFFLNLRYSPSQLTAQSAVPGVSPGRGY